MRLRTKKARFSARHSERPVYQMRASSIRCRDLFEHLLTDIGPRNSAFNRSFSGRKPVAPTVLSTTWFGGQAERLQCADHCGDKVLLAFKHSGFLLWHQALAYLQKRPPRKGSGSQQLPFGLEYPNLRSSPCLTST